MAAIAYNKNGSNSTHNQSGAPHHTILGDNPTIAIEVTPRSHKRDTEFGPLSEEQNAIQKNPQQMLVFCTFGPTHHGVPCTTGSVRTFSTSLDANPHRGPLS